MIEAHFQAKPDGNYLKISSMKKKILGALAFF
jgi:hypothetical protein